MIELRGRENETQSTLYVHTPCAGLSRAVSLLDCSGSFFSCTTGGSFFFGLLCLSGEWSLLLLPACGLDTREEVGVATCAVLDGPSPNNLSQSSFCVEELNMRLTD